MKKLGKIRISDVLFESNLGSLQLLFANFIPIHIEHRPHMRDEVYTGQSEYFDPLNEGEEIPFYTCTIIDEEKIKFEKETS